MSKIVFSAVAPSGAIHLGNYLGAIKNWAELQKTHQCIFCVVDLHAITTPQDPSKLREKILEVTAIYLAAGIDQEKSIIFTQSHNQDHTELAWILNALSRISDLIRMTQFKDKTGVIDFNELEKEIFNRIKQEFKKDFNAVMNDVTPTAAHKNLSTHNQDAKLAHAVASAVASTTTNYLKTFFWTPFNKAGVGLFDYPVLMASDILLYNTDIVPVGEDQKQHVELARTLARRFNQQFGEVFKVPEAMIRKEGARIMGLDDPTKKMSKSASSPQNYIALTDSPDIIKDKIKRAITDSGKEIKYDPASKPAISNLLMIYSLVSDKPIKELESQYKNHTSYAEFKNDLAEAIINFLMPFQKNYNKLISDSKNIKKILAEGAEKAKKISRDTIIAAKNKMGLLN